MSDWHACLFIAWTRREGLVLCLLVIDCLSTQRQCKIVLSIVNSSHTIMFPSKLVFLGKIWNFFSPWNGLICFCFVLWHINHKGSFNAGSVFEVKWCYFIFLLYFWYILWRKNFLGGSISLNTLLSIYFVWTFIISIFLTFFWGEDFFF